MPLYARIEIGKVTQLMEASSPPFSMPPVFEYVDVTGNTEIKVGWNATYSYPLWVFTKPTDEQLRTEAQGRVVQTLNDAVRWLLLNPLQYKVDIGVASTAEEAQLLAYKQYCVSVSEVDKQAGYPETINWPVAPW